MNTKNKCWCGKVANCFAQDIFTKSNYRTGYIETILGDEHYTCEEHFKTGKTEDITILKEQWIL